MYDLETYFGQPPPRSAHALLLLCDISPARWGRRPWATGCRVARHPRAHKSTDTCGSKSIGHPQDDNDDDNAERARATADSSGGAWRAIAVLIANPLVVL